MDGVPEKGTWQKTSTGVTWPNDAKAGHGKKGKELPDWVGKYKHSLNTKFADTIHEFLVHYFGVME